MKTALRRVAVTAASIGLIGTGTAVVANPAAAGPGPGALCHVSRNTQVFSGAGNGDVIYTVQAGDAVRILAGPYYSSRTGNYYWYGHGNGRIDGYMLADGRYYGPYCY